MRIKTDADVMRVANKIDDLNQQINRLISAIEESEHPNARKIADGLYDECSSIAWANHIAHGYLQRPEQWDAPKFESGGVGRYYHVIGRKARQTRFNNKLDALRAAKAITPR